LRGKKEGFREKCFIRDDFSYLRVTRPCGPKEDAYRVVEKWGEAFGNADVDGITKLYAPDASMIGTLGKVVLTKPEQIRE
jgi:hypothetical protein